MLIPVSFANRSGIALRNMCRQVIGCKAHTSALPVVASHRSTLVSVKLIDVAFNAPKLAKCGNGAGILLSTPLPRFPCLVQDTYSNGMCGSGQQDRIFLLPFAIIDLWENF
jgi:hypothetical protein